MLRRLLPRPWPHKLPQPTPVDVLTGYAHWAKSYPAEAHNPLMELEEEAMLNLLPPGLERQTCLDLGCGSGRYLHHLRVRGAGQVIGLDYSPHMLARAADLELSRFSLFRAPFFPLPLTTAAFDLITCGLAVGHESNLTRLLVEAGRVLRPGGMMLYSDFHPFGALAGWKRSFTTAEGETFSLEHYIHLYSDHQAACEAAGLTIEAVLEPLVGESGPPEFRHFPAVLVIRVVRR